MDLSQEELLSRLRDIDEYEFEELVADIWEQNGWETTVTTGSNDGGIDVIAQKSIPYPQKHLLQAKRYAAGNKIGRPDIQQYYSLKNKPDVDAVAVVTTSSFSSQAEQAAKELNLKLIDSQKLCQIISELNNPQDLLSKYTKVDSQSTESESSTEPKLSTELNSSTSYDGSINDKVPDHTSVEDFYSDSTETVKYSFRQPRQSVGMLLTDKCIRYINGPSFKKINYNEVNNVRTATGGIKSRLILELSSESHAVRSIKKSDIKKAVRYIRKKQ
jgi:hypothetical protein